jgi:hygromycin-B 7''-O-kinase
MAQEPTSLETRDDPAPVYSERLGAIADAQFDAAMRRLGLGAFVSAEPVKTGLFGQNVFVTTTTGAFVLRGAPHWVGGRRDDRWQFAKEAFFIERAAAQTDAPAPWPCHYDPAPDIFGWPYLVMPRMPGQCFTERELRRALPPTARRDIAASLGPILASFQRLTGPAAGDFDVETGAIAADAQGFGGYLLARMNEVASSAEQIGLMTSADMDWVAEAAHAAQGAPPRPVTFTHGDYKLDNMTLAERDGGWRTAGLFDFHTARFGDAAYDLVRPANAYRDTDPDLAGVLVGAWRGAGGDAAGLAAWLPLYLVTERIGIWRGFVKPDTRPAWSVGHTFRSWSEGYLETLLALI